MPFYTDQMNRTVNIPEHPQRIVSLVPSQTELLVDLGLEERLVGLTKFCVHPQRLKKQKTIIGGTKNFHFDKIEALQPDLIIGNKEENYQKGIELLAEKYPVWMSDISTLEDALEMMKGIGEITGTTAKAKELIHVISLEMASLSQRNKGSAVYLIWKDPVMAAGTQTFIHYMLGKAGFTNLVQEPRYPELSMEDLKNLSPDFLLLSSEPFPFKQKHIDEFAAHLPQTQVQLVDGEMFSWYGSRLRYFREYVEGVPF
ncbi:ABC transporter substrate-binding protein [Cecembia calidifontis]|uniref:ABC-type Fe3+-hydroxamate transport system substrate-binding protein n=1 Tax=Cecembia calidifontis TaxID=1187080 RepID=A0A4Q7PBD7_9BACT|nr:helical backbone metal receptor [Cecembia calidifontis]RZS96102.1 ABC-type Fe3+-hydroxamate transport system substrate-binding protein [Cecembia calidifontis]